MKTIILRCLIVAIPIAIVAAKYFSPNAHDHFDYDHLADFGKKVVVDRLGNVYVAGTGTKNATSDHTDMVLVKYNASLQFQWSQHYDGPVNGNETLTGLALDSSGNIFVSGTSPGYLTGLDVVVKGFQPNGDDLWSGAGFDNGAKRYNSSNANDDKANDMCIDASNNIVICGSTQTSSLVIVFEPSGAIKYGWPQIHTTTSYIESLGCVAVDTGYRIATAGTVVADTGGAKTNLLVLNYTGGGSLSASYDYDFQGKNDSAADIAFNAPQEYSIAVNVETSGESNRFSVWHFEWFNEGYDWMTVYTAESHVSAVACDVVSDYATGWVGDSVLTVKLVDTDGAYDSTWSGDGVQIYTNDELRAGGLGITLGGKNAYVTGFALNESDDSPENEHYLTLAYSAGGSQFMDEFYPETAPISDDRGVAVTTIGRGYVYVTGEFYDSVNADYEMGSLLYVVSSGGHNPSSSTMEIGDSSSGAYTDLASSNNTYQAVVADTGVGNPQVSLRVEGNVGWVPGELTFQVEAKVSTSGINQRIQLFNYSMGEYVTVDTRPATQTDQTLYILVSGDPAPYVNGSYNVKARIQYDDGGAGTQPWTASVDHVVWHAL